MSTRPYAPSADAFWEAVDEGRLVVQECTSCGSHYLPPRYRCPRCGSLQLRWRDHHGRGRLVSATVVQRGASDYFKERVPYVVAIAELDGGARLMANVLGDGAVRCGPGTPVQTVFVDGPERRLPAFATSADPGPAK